jgi:UDP-glucose/GDP-mannose dehydrogenase family, central domain/UDP-glucose/GDP-mannose dehydrogenase family, NAD binding domain
MRCIERAQEYTVAVCFTVPPGTAERLCIPLLGARSERRCSKGLHYVASPEFLREGNAVRDFASPSMTLAGVREPSKSEALRTAHQGIDTPFPVAPYRTVESVKLLSNTYHALKVTFTNEAAAVLAAHDVDLRDAFSHFCADDVLNISAVYLRLGFAFGGGCLTKDLSSFLASAKAASVPTPLLGHVVASNQATIERAAHLARPEITRIKLAEGCDAVVWFDADVFVFDPDRMVVRSDASYAFSHDAWVTKAADGRANLAYTSLHNTAFIFTRGQTGPVHPYHPAYRDDADHRIELPSGGAADQRAGVFDGYSGHNVRWDVQSGCDQRHRRRSPALHARLLPVSRPQGAGCESGLVAGGALYRSQDAACDGPSGSERWRCFESLSGQRVG